MERRPVTLLILNVHVDAWMCEQELQVLERSRIQRGTYAMKDRPAIGVACIDVYRMFRARQWRGLRPGATTAGA